MTKPTSEQVTFLAAGSGASQRTVLDKLRDVVSVKDFGAVGNGVADDTAAFNAAWTARSPDPVLVPPGSYAITGTVTGEFYTFGTATIVGGTVNTVNRFTGAMRLDGSTFVVDATNNRVGINNATPAQALDVTGNAAVSGDLEVNGADITTTASGTATVFNATATTVNVGGAATAMAVGSQSAGTVTVNNLSMNAGYGSIAPVYGCRAWVNFNGTGTVAIRADANVSSITDGGTGTYTVNFDTSMPDANYSTVTGTSAYASSSSGASYAYNGTTRDAATNSVRIYGAATNTGALADLEIVNVAVFR